jgi:hypothetical protein
MTLDIRIESAVLSFIFKKPERSDTTLRHSIFCGSTVLRFSFPRFCGLLFDPGPAIEATDLVIGLSWQLSGFLILKPDT